MRRLIVGVLVLAYSLLGETERLNADITTNLVGWWQLDANANDSSGNGHNGTVFGATPTQDRFGGANSALLFNGSSAYVSVANAPDLNPTSAITFTAWFNPAHINIGQLSWPVVLKKSGAGTGYQMEMNKVLEGTPEMSGSLFVDGGACPWAHLPVSTNMWYFGAGVYDGSSMTFYLGQDDGSHTLPALASNTTSGSGNILNSTGDLWIGADPFHPGDAERMFDGAIDDVRIYNRALTASEINAVYTVPEPSTLTIFAIGGLCSLAYAWRRRKRSV